MATTSAAPTAGLADGAQLGGGRYQVGELLARSSIGAIHRGVERASGRPIEILAAAGDLARAVEDTVQAAGRVYGDGLSAVIEVATEGSLSYAVMEAPSGHPLGRLLERKRQHNTGPAGFAPRAAIAMVGRLAALVGRAHAAGIAHGWLGAPSVRVDKDGEVAVVGLGLAPLAGRGGREPVPADDIAALGSLLYQLLVGEAPTRGCPRPSQVVSGLTPAVDQIIAAAMHPDVARRPRSTDELRAALQSALATARAAEPAQPTAGSLRQGSGRASLAESISGGSLPEHSAAPAAVASVAVAGAPLDDTDEAWLINKSRLDYGPFTMAEVVAQVRRDEILPGHLLINKHSGDRTPIEDHPLLAEIVDEARAARDERRRAQAEVVHAKTERRRGALLYVFIAAAIVGLGGGAYLLVEALSSDSDEKKARLGSIEEGQLQAKISFPTAEEKKQARRRGKGKRRGGGIAGGWDDTVDLGDASEEGGDERLSDADINPVVQTVGGRLGSCLTRSGERKAAIAFIIKGNGRVSYVKVNGKTDGALANCIRGVMKSLAFPTFDGTRTKANFTMAF
jgi:hypothetical protein